MEILASRISVYEIEVRLGSLEGRSSHEFPDFVRALVETLPSLSGHKCVFGREGGFVEELRKGTDFAHILEHVILEFQHLADPEGRIDSGWTRQSRDAAGHKIPGLYTIHYETRDPLTGHLAAILALWMITRLLRRRAVDLEILLSRLRNPEASLQDCSPESVMVAAGEVLYGLRHPMTSPLSKQEHRDGGRRKALWPPGPRGRGRSPVARKEAGDLQYGHDQGCSGVKESQPVRGAGMSPGRGGEAMGQGRR